MISQQWPGAGENCLAAKHVCRECLVFRDDIFGPLHLRKFERKAGKHINKQASYARKNT